MLIDCGCLLKRSNMKIAIKGHESRGKEVIQILESLGGRNTFNYNGDFIRTAYFIGMDYSIYGFCTDSPKVGFKVYTLEEFEREFPFKIGDKVKYISSIGIIKEYCYINNEPAYKVKSAELGIIVTMPAEELKPYKKMERNITLTLDKAKEWYKKGGELKEIALQAFTEQELNPLPRSWEEFCEKYPVKKGECILETRDRISVVHCDTTGNRIYKNWIPSQKSAEAHLAMIQLEQLRDCWRQGWEPDWSDAKQAKCYICYYQGKFKISTLYETRRFLSFPTYEMAKEFLECFRDLIEKAGDLI